MPEEVTGTVVEVPRKPGSQEKTGIGMLFEKRSWEPYFRITGVPEDGTAKAAGVMVDDFLLEVDGEDITDLPARDVTARILGPPGSTVQLKTAHATQDYPRPSEVEDALQMPVAEGVDNEAHVLSARAAPRPAGEDDLPIPDDEEETAEVQTTVFGESEPGPKLKVAKDNVIKSSEDVRNFQGDRMATDATDQTSDGDNPLKPLANLFGADDVELNPLDPFAPQVRKSRGNSTDDEEEEPDPMDTDMTKCSIM